MKDNWVKKGLIVSVILLFIGVAIAPSINFTIVKASNDNDLVEVTTQVCGIKGYGNTTVKLTRQQYQNLEQYLVDFRARLNQTTTREEAVPIFKETVVELNKYGLLPKGMSVEKAQQLILGGYQNPRFSNLLDKIQYSYEEKAGDFENYFCLTAGHTTVTITRGPILTVMSLSANRFFLNLQNWFFTHYNFFTSLFFTLLNFLLIPIFIFLGIANFLSNLCPFMFLSTVGIGCFSPMGPDGTATPVFYPAMGWLYTNGLNGLKNWSGNMWGNTLSDGDRIDLGIYEFYPGILGFSGIKINLPFFDSFYLGHAFEVKVSKDKL